MNQHKERGAVLIVAMIILAVLTVLGMAAMDSSTLQIKMASNFENGAGMGRDFQAAEDGLAVAAAGFEADVLGFQADLDDGAPYPSGTTLTNGDWLVEPFAEDDYSWNYLVTGSRNGATHRMFMRRVNVPLNFDGLLSCYLGCTVDLFGNVDFDARDHDGPSDFGCTGNSSACIPSLDPFGSTSIPAIYQDTGGTVNSSGSVSMEGSSPLIVTGGGGHTTTDWLTFMTLLQDFATVHNGATEGGAIFWGDRTTPVVHIINQNMMITGNQKSAGILLITADQITFSADFYHEGLIVISNPNGIDVIMKGGFDVCGAMVTAGPNVTLKVGGAGTPKLSYCSDALANAATNSGFLRLGWFTE
jgi:hypothetical protein